MMMMMMMMFLGSLAYQYNVLCVRGNGDRTSSTRSTAHHYLSRFSLPKI